MSFTGWIFALFANEVHAAQARKRRARLLKDIQDAIRQMDAAQPLQGGQEAS